MIHKFNIKRFILVFAICTVIFTPLLIEARNNALNLLAKSEPSNEVVVSQFAPLPESASAVSIGVSINSDLKRSSRMRQVTLAGHQGLRPKINNR